MNTPLDVSQENHQYFVFLTSVGAIAISDRSVTYSSSNLLHISVLRHAGTWLCGIITDLAKIAVVCTIQEPSVSLPMSTPGVTPLVSVECCVNGFLSQRATRNKLSPRIQH